jgi:FtsH-binding integral membrane protein
LDPRPRERTEITRTALFVFDVIAALVLGTTGLITLYMGVVFGLLVYTERPERGIGGHEFTIGLAALQLAIAALLALAAGGLRMGHAWAGKVQLAGLVLLALALSFFCAPAR